MNKRKLILISILLAFCPFLPGKAQGFDELVLQLSQPYPGGTARMLGLGGSKVALGADAGNIFLNPAGLGFYNRSEWVLSPSINYINTSTEYLGTSNSDNKMNFNFANLALVFNRSKPLHNEDKWRGGSFSFAFNRVNTFHNNAIYQGFNTSQDIIDYAVTQDSYFGTNDITDLLHSVGVTGEFFVEDTGQETIEFNGGVFPVEGLRVEDGKIFFTDRNIYDRETGALAIPTEEFPVLQREEYSSRGAEYAASLAYGGNYNDKLYIGAGLNVMSVDKRITRFYTEQPTEANLSILSFTDKYILSGTGINVNVGLIARPIQSVLLGISYTSPTYYGLEETREFEMEAEYVNNSDQFDEIIYPLFNYNLRMPSKIRGGITYFFGKNGFVSADITSSKTTNAEFSNGADFDFSEQNLFNQQQFVRTVQAGFGAEYRMDIFRFRAGLNYTTDPSETEGIDFDRMMYGIGAGIKKKNFFVDLAYNYYNASQHISPYPTAPLATVDYNNSMTTLSVGFSF